MDAVWPVEIENFSCHFITNSIPDEYQSRTAQIVLLKGAQTGYGFSFKIVFGSNENILVKGSVIVMWLFLSFTYLFE